MFARVCSQPASNGYDVLNPVPSNCTVSSDAQIIILKHYLMIKLTDSTGKYIEDPWWKKQELNYSKERKFMGKQLQNEE